MTDLLTDWRSGVWLALAPDAFTRVRRPRSEPAPSAAPGGWRLLAERDPELREQWLEAGASLGKLHNELSRSAKFASRQRKQFFEKIQSGELFGLGWPATATADDPPQRVPIHLFEDRFIKWGKSEIQSEHFHFRQVKIIERKTTLSEPIQVALTSSASLEHAPARKPGPKSGGELLLSAYDELLANGKIPEQHSLKAAWGIVRDHVLSVHKDSFPGERGLSYKSFDRHFKKRQSQR